MNSLIFINKTICLPESVLAHTFFIGQAGAGYHYFLFLPTPYTVKFSSQKFKQFLNEL